jgi:hydroxyquinol 1,2-dioxygenase
VRNLNEDNITQAVLARLVNMPESRLKSLLTSLVQHLHAFARETKLTEAEWMQGIQFLTDTGHMCTGQRQEFILLSDTLGLSQLVVAQSHSRKEGFTEQTVFGPFHVAEAPALANGADIAAGAAGEPLYFQVQVVDGGGTPVADATVDVWQADADGFYDVQSAGWTADEMKLRAVFRSDAQGWVSGRSVLPKSYPIPMDGPVGRMITASGRHPFRPAHLHFMVHKPGFERLVTHVFADGDEYLDSDVVFGVRSSCIGHYRKQPAGHAPDGRHEAAGFYTLDFKLVLAPEG